MKKPNENQIITKNFGEHLDTWKAQFKNKELEQKFQIWQISNTRQIMIIGISVLLILTIANLIIDLNQRNHHLLDAVSPLRWVQVGISGLALFLVTQRYQKIGTQHVFEVYIVLILANGLIQILTHAQYQVTGPISQIGAIFSIYLLLNFPWQRLVIYALSFSLIGYWGWFQKLGMNGDFLRLGLWLFFTNSTGAFVARQRHLHERHLFATRHLLGEKLEVESQLRKQLSSLIDLLSHELRNPLAAIQTQAELIKRTTDPTRIHHTAEKITGLTQQASNLICEWINTDKIIQTAESIDRGSHTQLGDSLACAILEFQHQHPEIKITLPQNELPPLLITPHVLKIAVINLLDNAVKYAPSAQGIRIQYRIATRRVSIRIRDWGPGIAWQDQDRVFMKHERLNGDDATHPAKPGMGVGLYLVRDLLERCGAQIRLQSQPGLGSAFIIEVLRA